MPDSCRLLFFSPREAYSSHCRLLAAEEVWGSRVFADKTCSGGKLLDVKDKELISDLCFCISCWAGSYESKLLYLHDWYGHTHHGNLTWGSYFFLLCDGYPGVTYIIFCPEGSESLLTYFTHWKSDLSLDRIWGVKTVLVEFFLREYLEENQDCPVMFYHAGAPKQ